MRSALLACAALLSLVACATPTRETAAGGSAPGPGVLLVPDGAGARAYLGLTGAAGSSFTLEQIKAEVVVVNGFDMYCHVCQADAKRVVAIYRELAGSPAAARIRMVGLGVGNTPMETHTFTSKFGLPFPTFPDRSNAIIRRFGHVRVPSLVILRRTGGAFEVVDRADSIPADPAAFANRVLSHL